MGVAQVMKCVVSYSRRRLSKYIAAKGALHVVCILLTRRSALVLKVGVWVEKYLKED